MMIARQVGKSLPQRLIKLRGNAAYRASPVAAASTEVPAALPAVRPKMRAMLPRDVTGGHPAQLTVCSAGGR